ncbi:pirin family protein [Naumannella sp. ID2617S]|nr:pirin family protein [Naumannella sp. ID2617S]
MTVRRTLPHRERSFVGAWCFVDHYGPDRVAATGGMDVAPHPHTGLQTVSWLFSGEIEHRDSAGVHAMVRPGELNLMTAGSGICHSEVSTPATDELHGVQLWVVLPATARDTGRDFQHHAAEQVELADGITGRVFLGDLAQERSPVRTFTSLLGAELTLAPGTDTRLPVSAGHEHAVLVDRGGVLLNGRELAAGDLGVLERGPSRLELSSDGPARVILLGGEPFTEEIVMWWNFIASDHDEVAGFREEWQAHGDRFGAVQGYRGETGRIPAPAIPGVRLRPRGRVAGSRRERH